VDSEPSELIGTETPPEADDERRVEELLRVNARLAAEVRSLALGRVDAPRSGSMPVARRLAALAAERETLRAEVADLRAALAADHAHRVSLERDNAELAAELARLRSGPRGLLRRLAARLPRTRD